MRSATLARILGYAGLLPFLAFALGALFLTDYPAALSRQAFPLYSLAILCFLAGTLWGSAIHYPLGPKRLRLIVSNGIVLFAVFAILTAQQLLATALLMLGHMAILWFERNSGSTRGWYPRLRAHLTWSAVALHLLYIIGLIVRNDS